MDEPKAKSLAGEVRRVIGATAGLTVNQIATQVCAGRPELEARKVVETVRKVVKADHYVPASGRFGRHIRIKGSFSSKLEAAIEATREKPVMLRELVERACAPDPVPSEKLRDYTNRASRVARAASYIPAEPLRVIVSESDYAAVRQTIAAAAKAGEVSLTNWDIAARVFEQNPRARSVAEFRSLEYAVRTAAIRMEYKLAPRDDRAKAIQTFLQTLMRTPDGKRRRINNLVILALRANKWTLKGRQRHKLDTLTLYLAKREGYHLALSDEIRLIIQASRACQEPALRVDEIAARIPENLGAPLSREKLYSRYQHIRQIAAALAYQPAPTDFSTPHRQPRSLTGKTIAVIHFRRKLGHVLTLRDIARRATGASEWQLEALDKRRRTNIFERIRRTARAEGYEPAPPTIQEKVGQILADAFLAGREITTPQIQKRLGEIQLRSRGRLKGVISERAIDRMRMPIERGLFGEYARGYLEPVAQALHKEPGRFSPREAMCMEVMIDAVRPHVPFAGLQPHRLSGLGYRGYDPAVRAHLLRGWVPGEHKVETLKLLPLAARCVFARAAESGSGLLSWYKARQAAGPHHRL